MNCISMEKNKCYFNFQICYNTNPVIISLTSWQLIITSQIIYFDKNATHLKTLECDNMSLNLESWYAIGYMGNKSVLWAHFMVNTILLQLMEVVFFFIYKAKECTPINFSLANAIIRQHFKMMKNDSSGSVIQQKEQRTEVRRSALCSWHCHFITVHWTLEKSQHL